ncbi:hypothetical protein RhiJN_19350 [Ceratobasidium sp. AG-Ba]|nr:hypothetical protein RhiJN_19350 [Ceratobasidium sp. AG-Ba]
MSPLPRINLLGVFRRRSSKIPTTPALTTPSAPDPIRTSTTYPSTCFHCPKILKSEAARSQHVRKWPLCRDAEAAALASSMRERAEARANGEPIDLHPGSQPHVTPLSTESERAPKRPRLRDTYHKTPGPRPLQQAAPHPTPLSVNEMNPITTPTNSERPIEAESPIAAESPIEAERPSIQNVGVSYSSSNAPPDTGWIDPATGYYIEPFPDKLAGAPISDVILPPVDLEQYMRASGELGEPSHFEMAELLLTSGMSDKDKNRHLHSVLYVGNVPWPNTGKLYGDVDRLQHGPEWELYEINVLHKNNPRVQYLMMRDIEHVIRDIISNPAFREDLVYAPVRVWTTPEKKERVYGDMWTADWWWNMQIRLRGRAEAATLIPLVIASDQTRLSTMCGGQKAYPVYVTVGNIGKDVRRKPSQRATVLLGYLPVDAFEDIADDDERRRMKAELIHRSMETMLRPLKVASEKGVDMWCADGRLRRVFPMVAAYIADWPEQNLMACTSEGSCPICVTKQKGRGDINNSQPLRDRNETLNAIRAYFDYKSRIQLKDLSLKPVWPWWASLPDTDFTTCLTPDLLHQLYQGVFKSHLVRWIQYLVGIKKLDSRFIATTRAAGMTHFGKGISRVQQWTGRESKEMLKQFLPLVVGDLSPELARLVTSAVEFIYRSHSSTMTETDLKELDADLETFHRLKDLMVDKGFYPSSARFDKIPKIHMLRHYSHSIRQLGTPDGYSTEAPEHLHIEYAKDPWRASNKVRPLPQMTTYIRRLEAIRIHRTMMNQWLILKGAPPILRVHVPDGHEDEDGREAEVEDECEPVELSIVARVVGRPTELAASSVGVTQSTGGVVEDVGATANVSISGAGLEGQRGGTCSGLTSDANTYHPDPVRRMAKYPTRPNLLVRDVIHDYGASDIKSAVADFLNKRFDIPGYNSMMSDSHRISLWHRLYLHHPPPPFAPLDPPRRDVVRASPTSLDDAGRPRKTGVWDVAMYLEKPNRRAFARGDPEKHGIHRRARARLLHTPARPKPLLLWSSRLSRAFHPVQRWLVPDSRTPLHKLGLYLNRRTPHSGSARVRNRLRLPSLAEISPPRQRIEAQREDGYARNKRALLVQPLLLPLYLSAGTTLAARTIKTTTFRSIASPHSELVGVASIIALAYVTARRGTPVLTLLDYDLHRPMPRSYAAGVDAADSNKDYLAPTVEPLALR